MPTGTRPSSIRQTLDFLLRRGTIGSWVDTKDRCYDVEMGNSTWHLTPREVTVLAKGARSEYVALAKAGRIIDKPLDERVHYDQT